MGLPCSGASLIANGSELWNNAPRSPWISAGTTPTLSPKAASAFVTWAARINRGPGIGISYVAGIPLRSQLGDDPLATILLVQTPINAQGLHVQGEWGSVVADGPVNIAVVPAPPAIWLLGTGCFGMLGWSQAEIQLTSARILFYVSSRRIWRLRADSL